ncbi:MAG TPA: LytR C-terminal domain-containing protein [Acidimicrobiales bacterium]
MQTTERPPTVPSPRQSPVRGVVLVAVAVVLGFFILRALDNTGADVGSVDAGQSGSSAAPTTGAPAGSDTTAPAARPPGEVIVLVANASGVQGAAAKQTEALVAAGYQTAPAGNAPPGLDLDATQIMATPGFEADAAKLATDLGKPDAVQPLTDPPPVDLGGANILVILGRDLAQGQ